MRWRAARALACGAALAVVLGSPALAGDGGPSGHWELDDLEIQDSSGNGHDGTNAGASPTAGAIDGALEVGAGDLITVPNSPDFEGQELTVSVWVRRDGNPGAFSYIVAKGGLDCYAASWAIYTGGGSGSFYVFDGASSFVLSPDAGPEIWDGEWHNLVGTYDGATVRLYVDGSEVGTGSPASLTVGYDVPYTDLTLGNYGGGVVDCASETRYTGALDDVAVWSRALAPEEVTAIQQGVAGAGGGATTTTTTADAVTTTTEPPQEAGAPPLDPPRTNEDRTPIGATLQNPDDVSFSPGDIARSVAVAAAIVLLIVFPSALFNSTLEENYDEVSGWFARFRRQRPASPNTDDEGAGRPLWDTWAGFALFMAASALLYSFLSPDSGVDTASLVSFIGILLGLVAVTLLFAWPVRQHFRRQLGDAGHIHVVPATLLIAGACVVVSRVADFQPGYLYGLIAGYAFSRTLAAEDEGRLLFRSSLALLAFALGAWLARLPLDSSASDEGASVLVLIADSVLATIFVGAVEGLVFGMIPIRFLAGEKLYRWDRVRWLAVIAAGTFLFVHVLLDPDAAYLVDTDSTSMAATLWLFGGFAALSVLFWAYFKVRTRDEVAAS